MQQDDNEDNNSEPIPDLKASSDETIRSAIKDFSPGDFEPSKAFRLIADKLRDGDTSPRVAVRDLLSWFGYQRRGAVAQLLIETELNSAGLGTVPDFRTPYIDDEISFVLASPVPSPFKVSADDEHITSRVDSDPSYRLSRLRAARNTPVSVTPEHTVREAITIMMANDFSQLPVMVGERIVKGSHQFFINSTEGCTWS